jgi:SAM-dependent methyltransferase
MIRIPTVTDWWELTREFPEYRRVTDAVLKDYGYLEIMKFIRANRPARVLEFGHGFSNRLFRMFESEFEMHGLDDDQGLHYFPEGDNWNARHKRDLADACPQTQFHRGLLGGANPAGLVDASFDLVCSVSVLEELNAQTVQNIFSHAHRLLKAGGSFINSFDFPVAHAKMIPQYLQAQISAGFAFEEASRSINFPDYQELLIENPTAVMLSYQGDQPEQRRYGGHWSTVVTVALKP